ncbi:MAG: primosomal protein N' [Bacteroidia bacterium]|nr:primosomal protein N' [Bacteroidia bacterium]
MWVRRRGLQALDYRLPIEGGPYMPGIRLLVPLGRYDTPHIGLLMEIHTSPAPFALKSIIQKVDSMPLYDEKSLLFFRWVVDYYIAAPGDVAHVALPGRVGGIADWLVTWIEGERESLPPKRIYTRLRAKSSFSWREAARELGYPPQRLLHHLRAWMRAGHVRLEAVVRQGVRAAHSFIEVSPAYRQASAFQEAWEQLPAALQPLFLDLLQRTLRGEPMSYAHLRRKEGRRLLTLLKKGLLCRISTRSYYERLYAQPLRPYVLTPPQERALRELQAALDAAPQRPILLHGVTASGKTFVYMELMRAFLRQGKQVLYLLPEIALTKQTLDRLRATFGEAMALYHSGLTEAERFRTWRAVREDAVDVLVGTRSALFLPFHRLGLLIVDEEHDPSFGQEVQPPLYQARDAAVYYAHLRGIPIILGSATPSLESYANALRGKYGLVSLPEKAFPGLPPELHIVDMRVELQERLSTGVFSSVLREALEETIGRGEQAILFRNRRGYAPMLLCQTCGHRWECSQCAVTLTYHKRSSSLVCHYCGHKEKVPARCSVCGSERLSFSGIGTERIEEQLGHFFPTARVLRLDRDTAGGHRHEALIAAFERGEADILVGTQMVTKGLDFERVTLVGVLYADSLLGRPDFRAEERAYQLLVQLMGRSGRRGVQSRVILQTFRPDTPLFHRLSEPYVSFAEAALSKRAQYGYPPFRRLIDVNLYHPETTALEMQAVAWKENLLPLRWGEILGPVYGDVPQIRGRYHMHLLLKLPQQYPVAAVRRALDQLLQQHYKRWGSKAARVLFRVDP